MNYIERARRIRAALDAAIDTAKDTGDTEAIIKLREFIRPWAADKQYTIGEPVRYGDNLYSVAQAHTSQDGWEPDKTPALFAPYHGKTVATALPWSAPTGAHDVYKAGEYMIWTDGKVMRCISDTVYSPADYAVAWEAVE
jgi:hypothetical protein